MKAFTPSEWKLSHAQKAKLLSADTTGLVIFDNSLAFRRLCDMGFIMYGDTGLYLSDQGILMVAYLRSQS